MRGSMLAIMAISASVWVMPGPASGQAASTVSPSIRFGDVAFALPRARGAECQLVEVSSRAYPIHRCRWFKGLYDFGGYRGPPVRERALKGLTPRAGLEKFAAIQMQDVHFSTTDGRTLIFTRYTLPEKDQQLLLHQLKLHLPPQPPQPPSLTWMPFS